MSQLVIILILLYLWWQQDEYVFEEHKILNETIITVPTDRYQYYYEHLPGEHVITVPTETGQKDVISQINSETFHDRFDYTTEKSTSTYRVVVLGSSWAHGLFVNTEDNATEVLEDRLNSEPVCSQYDNYEVINLAVSGHDPLYSVERFLRRGLQLDPDLVIFYLTQDNLVQIREFALEFYDQFSDEENLLISSEERDQRMFQAMYETYSKEEILELQIASLQELRDAWSGPLILYTLPVAKTYQEQQLQGLRKFVGTVPDTILYESLVDLDSNEMIIRHPNEVGHEKIADDVYQLLSQVKDCQ